MFHVCLSVRILCGPGKTSPAAGSQSMCAVCAVSTACLGVCMCRWTSCQQSTLLFQTHSAYLSRCVLADATGWVKCMRLQQVRTEGSLVCWHKNTN